MSAVHRSSLRLLLALVAASWTMPASAQWSEGTTPPASGAPASPAPSSTNAWANQAPAAAPAPAPAAAPAPSQPVGYGNYYGRPTVVGTDELERPEPRPRFRQFGQFTLGVPIVLDTDRNLIRPGATLYGAGGLEFDWIAVFFDGGFRWVPVDFDRAANAGETQYAGYGREPLKNFFFGPGIRFQIPNLNKVLPYVSGAFDFNFFNFRETAVACGGIYYWWCTAYNVWKFAPGFSGRVGVAVQVKSGVYVDLGAQLSMSFQGNFFPSNVSWVEPFVGITGRR